MYQLHQVLQMQNVHFARPYSNLDRIFLDFFQNKSHDGVLHGYAKFAAVLRISSVKSVGYLIRISGTKIKFKFKRIVKFI
jgi:hypothetical protein